MKTNWEKKRGDHLSYVEMHDGFLNVGSNEGTMDSDFASTCTYPDFLAGRFQDTILSDHGSEVLAEIIAAVQTRLRPNAVSD